MKQGAGFGIVQSLCIFYVIVWSISPPLEIDMIYRLLALGCVGIWALSALKNKLYLEKIHVYALFFAIVVAGIAYVEKGSFDAVLQQIAIYILVICFIINSSYRRHWDELRWILPVIFILLTYYNWNTGTALANDPTIARRLVRADESVYLYLRQGIGGYSLIYPQVCIFPALLLWTVRAFGKKKIYFLLGIVWLASYVRVLLDAGYSLAIFVTCASTVILFFIKRKSAIGTIVVSIMIFAGGLLAIIYFDPLREFLLVQFDGTAVARKINDLMYSFEDDAMTGSLYDRMVAYTGSINVIIQYPVIGSLWNGSGGGHSALLDVFAKYGLLGGTLYGMMIFHVPNSYKKKFQHAMIVSLSNALIVSLFFVAFLDSFPYSFMCMILLVLPLLYEDIIRWENIRR